MHVAFFLLFGHLADWLTIVIVLIIIILFLLFFTVRSRDLLLLFIFDLHGFDVDDTK